jgi:uncharacterized protein DUF4365
MAPEPERPLPRYGPADQLGDLGMRMVERIANEELGWLFRDQTRHDFGIDALFEVLTERREATGRLIAVQVKCGSSYFAEPSSDREGYVYRGDRRHLNYWLGHSLPVIVVLCDEDSGECLYTQITEANVRDTGKGWSTVVPRDQRLDATARESLRRLAAGPQRQDVIELALLRHLVERWGDRLRIASIAESPRDFHRFPYLIQISGDTGGLFGVQFIDTVMRPLTVEAVAEEVKWREHNGRSAGVPDLMLFAIGDSAADSRPSPELSEYLSRQEHLRWTRLVYRAGDHDFSELDERENVVWRWPGDDEPFEPSRAEPAS